MYIFLYLFFVNKSITLLSPGILWCTCAFAHCYGYFHIKHVIIHYYGKFDTSNCHVFEFGVTSPTLLSMTSIQQLGALDHIFECYFSPNKY